MLFVKCTYPGCKNQIQDDFKIKMDALDWYTASKGTELCPDHTPDWLIEWQNKQEPASSRIARLKSGDWSFGHAGTHLGTSTDDCPRFRHHHHDDFCSPPKPFELIAAGIDPNEFKMQSRG